LKGGAMEKDEELIKELLEITREYRVIDEKRKLGHNSSNDEFEEVGRRIKIVNRSFDIVRILLNGKFE
jgi:hypothetical protein